jgi:hypothetical protein
MPARSPPYYKQARSEVDIDTSAIITFEEDGSLMSDSAKPLPLVTSTYFNAEYGRLHHHHSHFEKAGRLHHHQFFQKQDTVTRRIHGRSGISPVTSQFHRGDLVDGNIGTVLQMFFAYVKVGQIPVLDIVRVIFLTEPKRIDKGSLCGIVLGLRVE